MASFRLLNKGTNAATLFKKLFVPIRSVSAAPSIRRGFYTNSAPVSAYEDFNRSIDEDRHSDSCVSRCVYPMRCPSQIFNLMNHQCMDNAVNPVMTASHRGGSFAPKGWDVKEDHSSLDFRFDMPGLDKDNVKITVEQNTLVIKAELENESEEDEEPPRRYSTKIDLSGDVFILNEIKAEMKNGVLKIMIPKVKAEDREDVWEVKVK